MTKDKKSVNKLKARKLSKRERRQRIIIYVMVILMLLSAITTGFAGLALF